MTDKKCLGIDCAWCASTECPNEKKEIDNQNIVDTFVNAYNKYFRESARTPWRESYQRKLNK